MYGIYINICKSLSSQNITLPAQFTQEEFISKINMTDYITMECPRKCQLRGDANVFIIIAAPNAKYIEKGPEFTKLLKIIPAGANQINIYSNSDLSTHVLKVVENYRAMNPARVLNMFHHKIFKYDLMTHVCSIPHEIMTPAEAEAICIRNYTQLSKFPKIYTSDPQIIWLGARAGMLIRIRRPSETAGEAILYRYCIESSSLKVIKTTDAK